ncbi:antibiotic biosynthesis monooxygenase [Aquabacterium sp. NJ1]|uniref:antibiotic biosynthesis monooxygenase family protein n=1 Tax=Aquabacterium sp. NJ1 TaxID=1538295 RepID=UPI00052C5498|nr:antibiotic biosynthesis monooxygenase [Aquabacterium sp. NJ1]KGM40490.1 antibiotic biosynthesis monooxygenase [Aquabacterium sp. NJ1]
MIAVIFELEPRPGLAPRYFELAEDLKRALVNLDGFISIERFESLTQPGRYVSLSFWRDEQSVQHWRNLPAHRLAQSEGRSQLFAQYRLRVATVIRDYGLSSRDQAPADALDALR